MKLKRFLLRYEPPGIGLEVEGQAEPIHLDLPANSKVTTSKDISNVVDNLIAEQSTLLTKRRHRPALMKLLSRLYQVELDATDDEAGEKSGAEGTEKEDSSAFQEGAQVVLINLKQKQQVHNGEIGTLQKVNGEKEKFEVLLQGRPDGESVVKVKGAEHIVPVAAKGTHLAVGTHVAIRGLRNHIELNGCLGRVVECHEESHRFEVRATESGQLFRVKQENLVPIEPGYLPVPVSSGAVSAQGLPKAQGTSPRAKKDAPSGTGNEAPAVGGAAMKNSDRGDDETFEAGSTVMLVGLKTAMCYNGQTAEVQSVDKVRCRYEIKLADGSVKTIRAENVTLVSRPNESKRTPRTKEPRAGGSSKTK